MRDEDFEEEWEWEKIEGEWEENEEWKEFGEFGVCREGYHEEYDYYAEGYNKLMKLYVIEKK